MNRVYQRVLWAALALAVCLSLVWETVSLPDASRRLASLPVSGFGFAGRDLPLNDVEKGVFGGVQTVKRLYQAGHQQFIVQVIDGSRNRHAIHDPLYCFRGAGWDVAATRDFAVPGGWARLLSLRKNIETAEALYWISDGSRRHASAPRYWWQSSLRRLTLGGSGPEPVLVVVQPATPEALDWSAVFAHLPALFDL